MRVLLLLTTTPPAVEGTDAVVQEAEALSTRFGGGLLYLVPGTRPRPWIPRALYGLHRLQSLRRLEHQVDLHHIYHAELYPFPVLRALRKPVVYTAVSGLGRGGQGRSETLARLSALAVPTPRDRDRLEGAGFTRAHVVPAGVDRSRFHPSPVEARADFVLLAGSAPWTRGQLRSKGVDALLEAARRTPWLRLVFLWRGSLLDELRRRVDAEGLSRRVEILTESVDVSEVLQRVHAAVVLAETPGLVRAHPHSLLEALACGRPVLVSDAVAMAGQVRDEGCGLVVAGVAPSDLVQRIAELRESYPRFEEKAREAGRRVPSREDVVEAYREVYRSALSSHPGGVS